MNDSKKKLLLGVVYTRRNLDGPVFCNHGIAQQKKNLIEARLKELNIEFVNLDFLNEEGIIFDGLDAHKVARHFTEKGVDALFCPHVNFGTEDAIAKIGKLMQKPLLLWALRDDAPDAEGNRATDSQCGLFATSKVLQQFGVPFSYMTNCTLSDPTFERVLSNFLAASQVVKSFRGMRVGQIGTRPDPFWSVKCNELQLLERFGIEVVPQTMIDLQNCFEDILKTEQSALEKEVARFQSEFKTSVSVDALTRTSALKRAIRKWADEMELDAVASSCWGPMRQMAGIASCFTFGELTGENLPVCCETDINGAISSVMSRAATRWQKPGFFPDITMRHPTNDNAELLWHCGVFPGNTATKECKPEIGCNFDEDRPTVSNFKVESGDITICRFDGIQDNYQLLMAQGKSVDGPMTKGSYGWFEFENWPQLEHKLIYGPYIHHCAAVYAKVSPVLFEACRYIPGLQADPISPGSQALEAFLI